MATSHAAHDEREAPLAHHFETRRQQFETAKLGMWAFLAQELLFFAGLFVAYGIFRSWYPEAFSAGSHLLDKNWGLLNTCVLLFSSFTVALALRAAQVGEGKPLGGRQWTSYFLVATILCACVFMVVKYVEYSHKFHAGYLPGSHFVPTEFPHGIEAVPYQTRSFFGVYFMMTGVHGLHVVIGIGVMIWLLIRNQRGEFGPRYFTPLDLAALYWHLVDLIWIYLFPLLYLID